jgi:hypothetical protein
MLLDRNASHNSLPTSVLEGLNSLSTSSAGSDFITNTSFDTSQSAVKSFGLLVESKNYFSSSRLPGDFTV